MAGEEGSGLGRRYLARGLTLSAAFPLYLLLLQESDIKWASRWDTYLTMSDVQIHWFSIINSVVVVFFLSGETSANGRQRGQGGEG